MKNYFLAFFLLLSVFAANAIELPSIDVPDCGCFGHPYVGADVQIRQMSYKSQFGRNQMHRAHYQGHVYGGIQMHENFAAEFGFETTATRTQDATLITGDSINGRELPENLSPIELHSRSKIKGHHLDVVGFLPLGFSEKTKLIGGFGMANMKGTVQMTVKRAAGVEYDLGRSLSIRKTIPRLMAGIEHLFNNRFSGRATVNWMGTSHMVIKNDDGGLNEIHFKPKNSLTFGAGVVFHF